MLLDLLLVLLAAKLAAEVAERLEVPAVLAEILAGVVIGPSALGLVGHSDVLTFLAELGVIILLLEVGLEMDLGELGAVGQASLLVAVAGVVLPFVGGFGVATLFGEDLNPAIFIGAALTATSVGITARVFGDLRALSTVEARTVLGAAVADDVFGLVILTVVVRIVSTGSVSVGTILSVIGAAVLFLALSGGLGIRIAPRLFALIDAHAKSSGTLVAAAVVFTLVLAELAGVAKLAPIIGAFVAGLSLGRSRQAERIRRDLTPISHLLVPVFFVQIGLDIEVSQLIRPSVLGLAGGLMVVATIGKVAASLAARGSTGDRWVIGLGMLPRGEVGFIFAGIGLGAGVLGEDLYAALLLVILATTLVTPPLLRWRLLRVAAARRLAPGQAMPHDGWLGVEGGVVELRGRPGEELALSLGLQAALLVAEARPGPQLLDWFSRLGADAEPSWDAEARRRLFALLREGNTRSWRFLETTGMLDRVLPELADTLRRRREDASELDSAQILRWVTVEQVHGQAGTLEFARLENPEWLLLAALILDIAGEHEPPVEASRQIVRRLRLGVAAEQEIALLLAERSLLRAAASRPDGLDEERVLPLALHLARPERLGALRVLTMAQNDLPGWLAERVTVLADRVEQLLAQQDVTGREARNVAEQRRLEAEVLAPSAAVRERLAHAPRPWLLGLPSSALARQAALLEPLPTGSRIRVAVVGGRVEIACRDRAGLLAAVTAVLAEVDLTITEATTATWPDGGVVMAFDVDGPDIDPVGLGQRIEDTIGAARPADAVPDAVVLFDDDASPWYTIADIGAVDRPGLLHALTAAISSAGVSIHAARVSTEAGTARDRFELTDQRGNKVSPLLQQAVRDALADGVSGSRSPLRRSRKGAMFSKRSSHSVETAAP